MLTKELFQKIDTLRIREIDYPTVLLMLNNMSNEMFTKCIEEIVNGNLYFSDFTDVLAGSGYDRALETIFKNQYELGEFIRNTKQLRKDLVVDPYDPGNFLKTAVGIDRVMVDDIKERINVEINNTVSEKITSILNNLDKKTETLDDDATLEYIKKLIEDQNSLNILNDPQLNNDMKIALAKEIYSQEKKEELSAPKDGLLTKIDDFYANEVQMMRDDVLYQITQPNQNDSMLIRSVKATLYKNIVKSGKNGSILDYDVANQLLLSLQDYILPIQSDFQMLTDADTAFMIENNLTEKEMKDMKTVAMFIQQKDIYDTYEDVLSEIKETES